MYKSCPCFVIEIREGYHAEEQWRKNDDPVSFSVLTILQQPELPFSPTHICILIFIKISIYDLNDSSYSWLLYIYSLDTLTLCPITIKQQNKFYSNTDFGTECKSYQNGSPSFGY